MLERILVPLDGSPFSESILPEVERLRRRARSEIVLLKTEGPSPVDIPIPSLDSAENAARDYLAGVRDRLSKNGSATRTIVRSGWPAQEILAAAEQEGASMIAMATHGRTGFARVIVGSVAEEVLRSSPVPVFIVRPFWSYEVAPKRSAETPVRSILLPLDGSDLSRSILPRTEAFAKIFGSRIILLGVLEGDPKSIAQAMIPEGLKAARDQLNSRGVAALALEGRGRPVDQIFDVCRSYDVDLIAMATHGRSGISRLVHGSVTEQVLRRANVPMLVMNPDHRPLLQDSDPLIIPQSP